MNTTIEKRRVKVVGWGEIDKCERCGSDYCNFHKTYGHVGGVVIWIDGDSTKEMEICQECLKTYYEEI